MAKQGKILGEAPQPTEVVVADTHNRVVDTRVVEPISEEWEAGPDVARYRAVDDIGHVRQVATYVLNLGQGETK